MSWLKRNLFLVIGVVVAFGLMGVAGFYLFTQKSQADGVTGDLNTQIEDLQRLQQRDPFPNAENIEAVKKEQKRVGEVLAEFQKYFAPTACYTNMDSGTFQEMLEHMLRELRKSAEAAGVRLPNKDYSATFTAQRRTLVFTPSDLVPLAHQVADIGALTDVLLKARVHALLSLRRVPVSRLDQGATEFLTGRRAVTNAVIGAVTIPYEVTFQGFSSELAAVLEGLYRSPHCFIVKNVNAERVGAAAVAEGDTESTGIPYQPAAAPAQGAPESAADLMRRRYGVVPGAGTSSQDQMRARYGPRGVPTAPAPQQPAFAPPQTASAPVRRGPETVLDERPLRFTVLLESVKLLPCSR